MSGAPPTGGGDLVDPAFLAAHPLPDPGHATDKTDRGTILVVGGSAQTPGAVLLAGLAALRVGAGKLQLATVRSAAAHLAAAMPEARVVALEETADGEIAPGAAARLESLVRAAHAVVVGPGMMDERGAADLAAALFDLSDTASFLVDAAAFTGLADRPEAMRRLGGRLVATPHAGEMAAFLAMSKDDVAADPHAAGCRAAQAVGGSVIMKGGDTHVCAHDGPAAFCRGGGVGLATSGSGDVLAGIVGGLLARGASPALAARWGTFLHAEAGRRLAARIGRLGFLARELADVLPGLLEAPGPQGADPVP
jgi:ADP-dependent NAD(P)H-hydrate dehydratase